MPEVTDLLGLAIDKNPTDFSAAIDDILRSKAAIALENKKNELAQSVYGSEDTDEVDFETADQEDDDFEDEDFEIDLEDLDLEDLDLEDLDGDELDA